MRFGLRRGSAEIINAKQMKRLGLFQNNRSTKETTKYRHAARFRLFAFKVDSAVHKWRSTIANQMNSLTNLKKNGENEILQLRIFDFLHEIFRNVFYFISFTVRRKRSIRSAAAVVNFSANWYSAMWLGGILETEFVEARPSALLWCFSVSSVAKKRIQSINSNISAVVFRSAVDKHN